MRAIGQRARSRQVTLRDVTLTVGHGELVAIIGGSGSGKTTLLDAMSGLRPPSTGTVLRADSPGSPGDAGDAGEPGRAARARNAGDAGQAGDVAWAGHAAHAGPAVPGRRTTADPVISGAKTAPRNYGHIGYVPSVDAIHQALPLARALRYSAALRAIRVCDGIVEDALRSTGLSGQADVPVAVLDAGQRKRAAIAAELLPRPSQLFLDEPTTGLDPAQGAEVMRLLRRLCDVGSTVVLTTQNPLDAARCDKVAVLATGGHLAFFGTPDAALDYFAADSLDEIYERLAGLGDPAAAWSRRFFHFSRTVAGISHTPPIPVQPGPATLLPDSAGPHSAGPVSIDRPGSPVALADLDPTDLDPAGPDPTGPDHNPAAAEAAPAAAGAKAVPAAQPSRDRPGTRLLASPRRLAILLTRNADVLARSRSASVVLAGVPGAILVVFLLLLAAGALNGPAEVSLAWAALAGLGAGLAYGLAGAHGESGVLRRERFAGLSRAAFVLAKAAALVPVLAVADLVILAVPALSGRLTSGFAPAYLIVLLASAAGLALVLARLVISTVPARTR